MQDKTTRLVTKLESGKSISLKDLNGISLKELDDISEMSQTNQNKVGFAVKPKEKKKYDRFELPLFVIQPDWLRIHNP